jgi:acetyl esterase/lipase
MNSRFILGAFLWTTCTVDLSAAELAIQRHLSYGESKENSSATSLDVYSVATAKNRPVMIYIHGGGWQKGDKANVALKPRAFTDHGFVFVSINYRLVPAVNYKEQAGDVARAIQYVHKNAAKWGGDAKSLFLMGHSAGAHLAALVAVDEKYLKQQGLSLDAVDGVVLLDGAGYDIPRHLKTARPIAKGLYERVFGSDPKSQADASPLHHVAAGKRIAPFLIIHVADRRDSRIQSNALAEAIHKAGGSAVVTPAEGKTHGSLNQELGRPDDAPTKAVFDFLADLPSKSRAAK